MIAMFGEFLRGASITLHTSEDHDITIFCLCPWDFGGINCNVIRILFGNVNINVEADFFRGRIRSGRSGSDRLRMRMMVVVGGSTETAI